MGNKTITLDTDGSSVYGAFKYGQGYINDDTYYRFLEEYNKCQSNDTIILNICSSSGSLPFVLMIANVMRNHEGKTIARVTKNAMSGGTLIALMCDEIEINRNGCLGPFDPFMASKMFYVQFPYMQKTFKKHKEENWICDLGYNMTNEISEVFERKIRQMLSTKYDEDTINELFEIFYYNAYPDMPIFVHEIPKCINYKVINSGDDNSRSDSGEQPTMSLFSQMMKSRLEGDKKK